MTETAAERTKRQFNQYIDLGIWTHQYSFFYQSAEDARMHALNDASKLKEKLRRATALKDQPFLYRLCLYRENAYHTIFTNKPVDEQLLYSIFFKVSAVDFKVAGREVADWKIEKYRRAVTEQRPHNLKRFFGDKKINRIALLNKKAIAERREESC